MEHGAPLQRRTTLSSCSRSAASVRRAGPMCPAARHACFPSTGARGPRPTGHRPYPGGQSRPPLRRVKEPCETGRRTPRAFVPLRSTAGRRTLRAVAVPIRRAGPMCPAAQYACFPPGGARGPRPTECSDHAAARAYFVYAKPVQRCIDGKGSALLCL